MVIIARNFSVESSIYSLINLDQKDKQITQNMQESLSNEIIFLSESIEILDFLKTRNNEWKIFSKIIDSINIDKSNENFLKILDSYKLATLDLRTSEAILKDSDSFVRGQLSEIFSAFSVRILPLERDILNLSAHSNLLRTNVNIDFSNGRIFALDSSDSTIDSSKKYFIARGILGEHTNANALLKFIDEIKREAVAKNTSFLYSGGAIFSAVGQVSGERESAYMSAISLVLIGVLLFSAFGSVHIFKLIFIIIFAFLCGLAGGFALLAKIHILSIVISTSLIGLVLDFSMHFLSLNYKHKTPISHLKKLFFIGFLIASSGYAIFLLSPMKFLHEIAVISIFTLFGAMIATYFLLPTLIQNRPKPHKIFRFCLLNFMLWAKKLNKKWLFVPILLILIAMPFLMRLDFSDNIREYYAPPRDLLDSAMKISAILNETSNSQFIAIRGKNSDDLIKNERELGRILKQSGAISDYSGISAIFLTPKEQRDIKARLLDSMRKNTSFLKKLNFDKSEIEYFKNQIDSLEVKDFSADSLETLEFFKLNRFLIKGDLPRDSRKYKNDSRESSFESNRESNADSRESQSESIMFLKNLTHFTSDLESQLIAYNARFIDFNASINRGFESIKNNAIFLKIFALIVAFVILCAFFGLKLGAIMTALVVISVVLSVCALAFFGINLNIFSIFGLILASVVGVDYMIFALHKSKIRAILGIILASLTSIISFAILATSKTSALVAFGASASICMGFCALFACIFAFQDSKG